MINVNYKNHYAYNVTLTIIHITSYVPIQIVTKCSNPIQVLIMIKTADISNFGIMHGCMSSTWSG